MQEPVNNIVHSNGQQGDAARRQQWGQTGFEIKGSELQKTRKVTHHGPPVCGRRLKAGAQEGQGSNGQEHKAETQAKFSHQRWHDVWQDFTTHHPAKAFTPQTGGFDVIHHGDVDRNGTGDPEDAGTVENRDDQDQAPGGRPENSQQHQREDQAWDRHQDVHET